MASLTRTINQQDGQLTQALKLSDIQWSDYSSFTGNNTLYKASAGDFLTNIITVGRSNSNYIVYGWDADRHQWIGYPYGPPIDDAYGYNFVVPGSGQYCYVAKDEHLANIPDFDSTTCYICRVKTHVKRSNITSFRHLKDNVLSGIPLFVGELCNMGSANKLYMRIPTIGIYSDAMRIGAPVFDSGGSAGSFDTLYDALGKIEVTTYWKEANTEISDLETRVSILENNISKLNTTVAEHDKVIKDLPAIVAATSSEVSKLYVAR